MDATAVRWESLVVVIAVLVLAGWALTEATRAPREAAKAAGTRAVFEVHRPNEPEQLVELERSALAGRGPGCQMIFHDATVSKEHARIIVDGSRVMLEDLRSTNGTLLNGQPIQSVAALKPGDRIALGANIIWFLGETSPAANRERL